MAVAPIYSKQQIDDINRQKKAIKDLIYDDVDGNKYIGTSVGTLRLVQYASSVTYNNTTVEGALNEHAEAIEEIESTMATDVELAEADVSLRGFALAMSLSL